MAYSEDLRYHIFLFCPYEDRWLEIIMERGHMHCDHFLLPKCGSPYFRSQGTTYHGLAMHAQRQKVYCEFHECNGL